MLEGMDETVPMARHGRLLWIIPLLIAGAALWWATGPERGRAAPAREEVTALQARADAACRCARTGNHEQCWAEYRRSAARFEQTGGWATACREESTATECFGPDGPNQFCVSTQRMYGACSDAEQRTRVAAARRRSAGGCQN